MISREQDLSWINLLIGHKSQIGWAFQVALVEKNPPANAEVRDVGSYFWVGKIPLEEGMATHSGILAWRIPWAEESGGLQSMGLQRVRHD